MRKVRFVAIAIAFLLSSLVFEAPLGAQKHEELGRMWTFENLPFEFFEEEYGFRPTEEWLDQVRLSALRFGGGCSSSFISPRGLIMTNHHCARDHVVSVSPKDRNWLKDGYFATSLAEEVPVPGLEVRQLVATENITEEVNKGISKIKDGEARQERIQANQEALLEMAKKSKPDLEHEMVSLYQGGMYQIYSYKVYDDIRLVGTPHLQSAKFGGDPDNFTYPRYSLDFAFVRAYENDQPADTSAHYLKWRTEGPKDGETVFVIGNPGSTGRLNTIAQMEYMRDAVYPRQLERIHAMLDQLETRLKENPDLEKDLRSRVLNIQNARKAYQGYLDGLRNDDVMNKKRAAEQAIRDIVENDSKLKKQYGDAWTRLEEISAQKTKLSLEGGGRGEIRELEREESAVTKRIGEAFFAVYGTEIPPDATFTLRVSDGVVKGFPYNGTIAPWFTSLYGLYARHTEFGGEAPFDLPQIWLDRRDQLDLSTPFNLVSTCDIIGGNSGSPMINTNGEIVGLIFDGNIEMLGNRFVFTDEVARSVSVHPAIIIESLRKIYEAGSLADEVEGKGQGYN